MLLHGVSHHLYLRLMLSGDSEADDGLSPLFSTQQIAWLVRKCWRGKRTNLPQWFPSRFIAIHLNMFTINIYKILLPLHFPFSSDVATGHFTEEGKQYFTFMSKKKMEMEKRNGKSVKNLECIWTNRKIYHHCSSSIALQPRFGETPVQDWKSKPISRKKLKLKCFLTSHQLFSLYQH